MDIKEILILLMARHAREVYICLEKDNDVHIMMDVMYNAVQYPIHIFVSTRQ